MKKLLCILLVLMICLPAMALADILTVDLETATIEELETTRAAIDAQLSALYAADSDTDTLTDVAHYEGSGLSMIEIETFPYFPCRMVFAVDAEGSAKVEVTGGNHDWKEEFTATTNSLSREYSYDCNNYGASALSLLVTTGANWTLDIYPLSESATPAFDGAGFSVGDLFTLTGPTAVTVSYNASANDSDYLSIQLVTPSEYGYLRETVINESLRGDGSKGSVDVFIKPQKDRPCFYIVECKPETTWSISPKN